MDYGEVLSKSWKIIWKFKILWLFGLLASCASRGGGGSSGSSSNYQNSGGNNYNSMFNLDDLSFQIGHFLQTYWWIIVLVVLGMLILSLALYFIGTVGKIGLVRGAMKADDGAEKLTFSDLFNGSLPYFWRVFWLNLLVGLLGFVLALLILIPALIIMFSSMTGSNMDVILPGMMAWLIAMVCILCLLTPVLWVVYVWVELAVIAMINENISIKAGLARGWSVIRHKPGPLLLMVIILGVISFVAGLIMALPLIAILIPFFVGMAGAINNSEVLLGTGMIIALAGCCLYMPVMYLLNSVVLAYHQTAYTLTYRRLTAAIQPSDQPVDESHPVVEETPQEPAAAEPIVDETPQEPPVVEL